jgi:hypothetical protein
MAACLCFLLSHLDGATREQLLARLLLLHLPPYLGRQRQALLFGDAFLSEFKVPCVGFRGEWSKSGSVRGRASHH